MGVTGLWKLIESSGKPVPIEMLENKVLCIDISIWLHQVVKGFQDNKGGSLANAHLLGLFHRLCKLMYYRIKPVFVFDGCVPHLKRETIAKRSQSRNRLQNEADRIQDLILQSLAREKIVQKALGSAAADALVSPIKQKQPAKPDRDEIFKLPSLPASQEEPNTSTASFNDSTSDADSSLDESNLRQSYQHNLQAIDVTSEHFKTLPADVRHEILTDIKETRKQSSWGRLHELPAAARDFSGFQMKRLLKRRQVQVGLDEAEKQMEGKSLTLTELETLMSEEGILKASESSAAKRIASDENKRFLLVKDLKKAVEVAKKEIKEEEEQEVEKKEEGEDKLGMEFDADLLKAIEMSLETTQVYSNKDYEYDTELELNEVQRKELKAAANSLARAYMIEYGGMNDDDVKRLVQNGEDTEANDDEDFQASFDFQHNDRFILKGEICTPYRDNPAVKKLTEDETTKSKDDEIQCISSSSEDSDFEEVTEITAAKIGSQKSLEIVFDPLKAAAADDDDLFADIFNKSNSPKVSPKQNATESLEFVSKEGQEVLDKVEEDIANVPSTSLDTETASSSVQKTAIEATNATEVDQSEVAINQTSNIVIKSPPTAKLAEILENIKNQSKEISTIQLDDIEPPKSQTVLIEDSDSDIEIVGTSKQQPKIESNEIIEIADDINKTPSKKSQTAIENFFETQFTIKRTPEKPPNERESSTPPPKVTSPFFVNKSSGSGKKRKSPSSSETTPVKNPKVAKQLFEDTVTDSEAKPLDAKPANVLEEAANILRENKTHDELVNLADDIRSEKHDLELEMNRQNRMGTSISDKMAKECMQLLRMFGVPYIVAPMEAEAQCAFLDAIRLSDGTITDDSDIWLFGGRTVYKNFFNQKKYVAEFKIDSIEKLYNLDRNKLIQLAILVGSDYTTGIAGIGSVTALEILASFPLTPMKEGETTETMSILSTLRKFRDWWKACKTTATNATGRVGLRSKLKNVELYEGFPNMNIVDAYLRPRVDDSRERFTWGDPDVETIREFTKKTFGWTAIKTDNILQPVLKKMQERKTQTSIKNFFAIKSSSYGGDLKVSKRVQKAIDRMSSDYVEISPPPPAAKKERKRNNKKKVTTKDAEQVDEASEDMAPSPPRKRSAGKKQTDTVEASTSADCKADEAVPKKQSKKTPRIPETRQVIPQRMKDNEEMERRKQNAAEIFKKSKDGKQDNV